MDIRLPRSTGTKKDLILLIENLKEAKELWVDCAPVHIETAKSWLADPYTKKLILDAVKSAGIILKLIKGIFVQIMGLHSTVIGGGRIGNEIDLLRQGTPIEFVYLCYLFKWKYWLPCTSGSRFHPRQ